MAGILQSNAADDCASAHYFSNVSEHAEKPTSLQAQCSFVEAHMSVMAGSLRTCRHSTSTTDAVPHLSSFWCQRFVQLPVSPEAEFHLPSTVAPWSWKTLAV